VRKVIRSALHLAADRFLTVPDALDLIREAARADIP
jgi:hypothetical protein